MRFPLVNIVKKIVYQILTCLLVFTTGFSSLTVLAIPDASQVERNDAPNGGYGVTAVHLDDFKYYEEPDRYTGVNNYHWYGTGLEVSFALPAEAKEGDYFTLTLPDELIISNFPMYQENEDVPYKNLASIAKKYGGLGMQNGNVWFHVNSKEDGGVGNERLLDVYYTKRNELTFVCTSTVNHKGIIKGKFIVGNEIPANTLIAYTDMTGRHYRVGEAVSNQSGSIRAEDESQAVGGIGAYAKSHGTRLYEGIKPNILLLSPSNGSRNASPSIPAAQTKNITFKARYGDAKEFILNGVANINYTTQLYKTQKSRLIANKISYGNQYLQIIGEDQRYLYYGLAINSNNGFDYNHNFTSALSNQFEIHGGNLITPMVYEDLFPRATPFLKLDFSSFKAYKGVGSLGTQATAMLNFNKDSAVSIPRPADNRNNREENYQYSSNGVKLTRIWDNGTGNYRGNDQAMNAARLNFPDNSRYYVTFRAEKYIENKANNGIPLMVTQFKTTTGIGVISDGYSRTTGFTIGDALISPPEYIATPSLKIKKMDENGNVLTGHQGKVEFIARDITYGSTHHIDFVNAINNEGEVTFPSLLNGHTYEFFESRVDSTLPYSISGEKYKIQVDHKGAIKITDLDGSDDVVINNQSRPLYYDSVDNKYVTYKFENKSKYRFRIKKVDGSNEIITGSKAKFLLYSPNTYRIVSNHIEALNNAQPKEIETNYNNHFGLSKDISLAPTASGTYYALEEVEAPNGSKKLAEPILFSVNADGSIQIFKGQNVARVEEIDRTVSMQISNEKVTRVVIDKYDQNTGNKMAGVRFELLDANKRSYHPKIIKDTDTEGRAIFDGLTAGTYYVKEIASLTGYVVPKNEYYKIQVSSSSTVDVPPVKVGENDYAIPARASLRSARTRRSVEHVYDVETEGLSNQSEVTSDIKTGGGG